MNNIEWIPTKERLPEKSGDYLVFIPHPTLEGRGSVSTVMYSAKHHLFNAVDTQKGPDQYSYDTNRVSHWAEIVTPEGWTL